MGELANWSGGGGYIAIHAAAAEATENCNGNARLQARACKGLPRIASKSTASTASAASGEVRFGRERSA